MRLDYEKLSDEVSLPNRVRTIWSSLFDGQLPLNEEEINKIYDLNYTIFFDFAFKRVDFYIKNHFWSLLDLYELDTWKWSDQNIFTAPKLVTYAIFKKDGGIMIIVVKLEDRKYSLLRHYNIHRLPLWKFKRKELVYEGKDGFISI